MTVSWFGAPTDGERLSHLVGRDIPTNQCEAVLGIVTAMARSYTRGNGFTGDVPVEDIAAVIQTAAARLLSDPSQNLASEAVGPFQKSYRDGFVGWSVAELFVLNRWRDRAG